MGKCREAKQKAQPCCCWYKLGGSCESCLLVRAIYSSPLCRFRSALVSLRSIGLRSIFGRLFRVAWVASVVKWMLLHCCLHLGECPPFGYDYSLAPGWNVPNNYGGDASLREPRGKGANSESAPVPVSWDACGNFGLVLLSAGIAERNGRASCDDGASRGSARTVGGAVVAGSSAVCAAAPDLEVGMAVGTGTTGSAPRVVVGILVKRHIVRRVAVAKDVATLATVVASRPVVEVTSTRRLVADGSVVVGLPVLARRLGGRLGKQVEVQLSIHALATVAGRASSQTAECAEAGEAAPAAAGLEAIVVVICLLGRCLFGRVVCRAQDGGNVERSQLAGVVGLGRSRRGTIRSAERRDLTAVGTGAQLLLELSLLRLRGGMRLGGDVRLLVVLRQLRVEVGAICWLLLIRQPGHYEVGSHYTVI